MKSWRTTLAGFLLAVALPVLEKIQSGEVNLKTILLSAGILAIAWFAKDAGVSGTGK